MLTHSADTVTSADSSLQKYARISFDRFYDKQFHKKQFIKWCILGGMKLQNFSYLFICDHARNFTSLSLMTGQWALKMIPRTSQSFSHSYWDYLAVINANSNPNNLSLFLLARQPSGDDEVEIRCLHSCLSCTTSIASFMFSCKQFKSSCRLLI